MTRTARLLFVVGAVLVAAGCSKDPIAAGGACNETTECQPGLSCENGSCRAPAPPAPAGNDPDMNGKSAADVLNDAKQAGDVQKEGMDKRMNDIMDQGKE